MIRDEKKREARELYVMNKVRNMTRLEEITGISRKTLTKWRTDEEWDKAVEVQNVDPITVLNTYLRQIHRLQTQIEEMEGKGETPLDSTLKRLSLYHKLAKSVKDDYNVDAMLLRFADEYIRFVSGIADFPGKGEYIKNLDNTLPKFMDFVLHGRS